MIDWNVILPLASAVLSLIFALMLLDQWRTRRRPYQLVWALGMLWYGLSAGTEWIGGAFGWSEPLYRAWYLIGAVWVAAWLGLGTVYLLARTRFGYSLAFSFALAGLFTYLTWRRYEYPDSGVAIVLYPLIGLALAMAIAVLTYRGDHRWASLTGAALVVGTIVSAALVLTVPLPAPGYYVDPATGIPSGVLYPGYIRLLTPFFNITGGLALVLGAVYSAYVFMPKRRVIHYDLGTDAGVGTFLRNLLISPVAIAVNLIASIPGRGASPARRPARWARPGDGAHRAGWANPVHHERSEPLRRDRDVLRRRVPRGRVPVRWVRRLRAGPRGRPHPVHRHRPAPPEHADLRPPGRSLPPADGPGRSAHRSMMGGTGASGAPARRLAPDVRLDRPLDRSGPARGHRCMDHGGRPVSAPGAALVARRLRR